MPQGKFSAQVSAWVAETKQRQEAVYKKSAERVIEVMQTPVGAGGNMPVRDGFLRASLVATTRPTAPSKTFKPKVDRRYQYEPGQITLTIVGASLSDAITVAFTANYARHQEYGARGRPGRRFVALAAQQWPSIVEGSCNELKKRAGG